MDFVVKGARFAAELSPLSTALHNWSRLEPLPVSVDLETNLRARLADPLFLLGRQWQLNEFQGEDAGTPIDVRLVVQRAPANRLHLGPLSANAAQSSHDFFADGPPLEALVEAESAPSVNLRQRAHSGLELQRSLRAAGLSTAASAVLSAFPLQLAAADPVSDAPGAAWLSLLEGRALDSDALARLLEPLLRADGTLSALPHVPDYAPATPGEAESFSRVLAAWYGARLRTFEAGAAARSAWVPERQEHRFQLRAQPAHAKPMALEATEYANGRLDWHSFVLRDDPGLGEPAVPAPNDPFPISPKLPTPVRYPGMPADRFWEFEDGKVSFGRASSGPTELMRLLLIEFALIYGNDWFYVPFELPVGSLATVTTLKVRDTFGLELSVPAASSLPSATGRPWRWFELTDHRAQPEPWFFLPPTLPARHTGDPLEEVALFRDEMANMAWGVERRVASPIAGSVDRALERYESTLHQEVNGADIEAELIYRLQTDVPNHWIPLVPVAEELPTPGTPGFAHWLERRTLIRTFPDGVRRPIHPRGQLLRSDPTQPVESEPPLKLAEEEVPREGALVRRSYQYTRWLDGSSHLWLGRDKTIGRGEGSSNLRFDLLVRRRTNT